MMEREMPLEVRKELAKEAHRDNVEAFGLDQSRTFETNFDRMKGMDHGPNHEEGDPAVHTQLVELAAHEFLQMQDHTLSETDQQTLKLATTLHDIGKGNTQKFDAVSATQNELVGATEEQVEAAKAEMDDLLLDGGLLARLKEFAPAEIDLIAEVQKAEDETRGAMGKKYQEEGVMSGKDKKSIQKAIESFLSRAPRTVFNPDKFPGIVPNFRAHDAESKHLSKAILEEMGVDLPPEQVEDVEWVVRHHMELLEPEKMNYKTFKQLFVRDGEVSQKHIDLLRAHAYADNAGTVNKRKKNDPPLLPRIDSAMNVFKGEFDEEKAREAAEERAAKLEAEIFADKGGKLAAYIAGRGLKGREMGMGIGKVKAVIKRMEGLDAERIRAEIDAMEF